MKTLVLVRSLLPFLYGIGICLPIHVSGAVDANVSIKDFGISSSTGQGLTFSNFIKNSAGASRYAGSIYVWKNGDEFIQLTGILSSIDELCRTVVTDLAKAKISKGDVISQKAVLTDVLHLYTADNAYMQADANRAQYLSELAKRTTDEQYRTILNLMPMGEVKMDEKSWKFTNFRITRRGAIEHTTFSGSFNPVRVTKYEVEVVAPAGTVPYFDFFPILGED